MKITKIETSSLTTGIIVRYALNYCEDMYTKYITKAQECTGKILSDAFNKRAEQYKKEYFELVYLMKNLDKAPWED